MINITNKRILKYLELKDSLVTEGRKLSKEITRVEASIESLDKKERKITEKVNPKELIEAGEQLKKEINDKVTELQKIGTQIEDMKLEAIPADMKKKHYDLRNKKEKLERERNKVALKIQKLKDRLVPILQKEVKPQLEEEFDDIESVELKGDEAVVKTFNHIENYKELLRKKK